MQQTIPRKITIVGGGTAGWMSASLLHHAWGHLGCEVLVIDSIDIPKIGVGEGSTPALKRFFETLNIEESEWMPACNATYKCGISFPSWTTHSANNHYFHPFYSDVDLKTGKAFIHNTDLRRQGVNIDAHPDHYWLQSFLAKEYRSPKSDAKLNGTMEYGYHFDSALLGEYLKTRAKKLGVLHASDTVEQINTDQNNNITQLITQSGNIVTSELFVDCTGFSSLLIGKTLAATYHSYSDGLLNDSAIAIASSIDRSMPIPPYTESAALSAGWAWRIPLSSRYGNGYVYSSKHISPEKAEAELREHIGPTCKDMPAKHISMRLGRVEKHWHKNVLAVGLSQGFIEPLEATALMSVQFTLEEFIQHYSLDNLSQQNSFNSKINTMLDSIKDYIQAHYFLNTRNDNQYWIDVRNEQACSSKLRQIIAAWDQPLADMEEILTATDSKRAYLTPSWYCLLAGKARFNQQVADISDDKRVVNLDNIKRYFNIVTQHFPLHKHRN
ncbi:tryptophan halogenase family protein [Shewanella fidelis]|uniref:Tryptophan 7-halogenase n=1 Tax=Shewanella fidelis TaxID=173509 RepID=A0AAW8NN90_9GAMM|nr:tryptophan halogenase family protein [Shewanella fidelis]MDR8524714.1 tryptophan 7-halogenase [Shewanella fidelis]MDW4810785.1 tryptophan 7-halogenase [Shewanella fidelis]MDW4815436.1 tryptophan 7-halogenase [Shewanella fidelis]MDW4819526.1 tryptophan 7-halogenase [Shewanella fidelis]MDW4822796.1 tryptophan 7-halogenase [Shewanella fidelis]